MSPVKDLEMRPYEVGRIRIGYFDDVNRHPAHLDHFRLTTADRRLADAAADLLGGEVRAWQSAPSEGEQWEVETEAKQIKVLVPPQDIAERQFYELWSAGGCQRRCDGRFELLSGDECLCDAEGGERVCQLVTHLNLILPQLPALGVWRLRTTGYNAARELTWGLAALTSVVGPGHIPEAILGIELRTSVVAGQTRHYAVPVMRLPVALQDLGSLDGGGRFALGNGHSAAAAAVDNEPDARETAEPEASTTATRLEEEEGAPAVDAGVSNPADTTAASDDPSSAAAASGDRPSVPGTSDAVVEKATASGTSSETAGPVDIAGDLAQDPVVSEPEAGEIEGNPIPPKVTPPPDPDADLPATDEQWNRAARLYGTRLRVMSAAAKLLQRTIHNGDLTRAEMVRVITAHKPGGAA